MDSRSFLRLAHGNLFLLVLAEITSIDELGDTIRRPSQAGVLSDFDIRRRRYGYGYGYGRYGRYRYKAYEYKREA